MEQLPSGLSVKDKGYQSLNQFPIEQVKRSESQKYFTEEKNMGNLKQKIFSWGDSN